MIGRGAHGTCWAGAIIDDSETMLAAENIAKIRPNLAPDISAPSDKRQNIHRDVGEQTHGARGNGPNELIDSLVQSPERDIVGLKNFSRLGPSFGAVILVGCEFYLVELGGMPGLMVDDGLGH